MNREGIGTKLPWSWLCIFYEKVDYTTLKEDFFKNKKIKNTNKDHKKSDFPCYEESFDVLFFYSHFFLSLISPGCRSSCERLVYWTIWAGAQKWKEFYFLQLLPSTILSFSYLLNTSWKMSPVLLFTWGIKKCPFQFKTLIYGTILLPSYHRVILTICFSLTE